MWPKIPENLKSVDLASLRELRKQIKAYASQVLDSDPDADALAEAETYALHVVAITAEIDRRARAASLASTFGDDDEADDDEAGDDEAGDDEGSDDEAGDTSGDKTAHAAKPPAKVRTTFGHSKAKDVSGGKRIGLEHVVARDGVAGVAPGQPFESWLQLAEAVQAQAARIKRNSSERFEVAAVKADYPAERRLDTDPLFNLARFEPDELVAALCAPATPYYDLSCMNTTRRPVFNSLPQFAAPRGGVSIYPSPSLSDITTGFGVWTADDDLDEDAVKEACQTIACATPTEYQMYGVYRCLTVKNMLAMTFPELVEAYLNRLAAAHARLGEQQLLDAMATGATTVAAPALGYGGSVSITTTILNYLALYQEQERWDVGPMRAWLPRWVAWAMKVDIARRRRTDGGRVAVPSDAEIAALFREVGVEPTFFIDTPTWSTPVPNVATAGVLNFLPQQVEILVAPASKYAVIDRGELAIGVTGNNIYRDNTSNSKNEFTFFFENFEGIVDTESCPAHILEIPACWNGVQIDDIVLGCEGGDVIGVGS